MIIFLYTWFHDETSKEKNEIKFLWKRRCEKDFH